MNVEGARQNEGDRFLVNRIQEGDTEAFRQLVDRFTGRLSAYAARRLGLRSAEVDDVVQETFLGLLQNVHRLHSIRSLEAYLFTILKNKMVDAARRSPRAHGMVSMPFGGTDSRPGFEPAARGSTPSQHAGEEEASELRRKVLADVLEDALRTLKAEKKFRDLKILELIFYSGRKGKEVATLAGTSEPTVTRTKAEAIRRLSRLAHRHPQADPSLGELGKLDDPTTLLSQVWSENLVSCLKRSTLGAYSLGLLDSDWQDYTRFHLETAGCETCAANLEDIRQGEDSTQDLKERVFTSSVGFVKKRKN